MSAAWGKWSKEEIEVLVNKWNKLPKKIIAQNLGRGSCDGWNKGRKIPRPKKEDFYPSLLPDYLIFLWILKYLNLSLILKEGSLKEKMPVRIDLCKLRKVFQELKKMEKHAFWGISAWQRDENEVYKKEKALVGVDYDL